MSLSSVGRREKLFGDSKRRQNDHRTFTLMKQRKRIVSAGIILLFTFLSIVVLVSRFVDTTNSINTDARIKKKKTKNGNSNNNSNKISIDKNKDDENNDGSHRSSNNNKEVSPPTTSTSGPKFYSMLRPDRSGAAIQDMLFAHAYAFQNGLAYGGACPPKQPKAGTAGIVDIEDHKKMITGLGLDGILPIACPPSETDKKPGTNSIMAPNRDVYASDDTALWTPEWLKFVRSKIKYPTKTPINLKRPAAVVHIRRSTLNDVHPCNDQYYERYLPNFYYQKLIETHVPPDYSVTIHSEVDSYEPWEDFKNYNNNKSDSNWTFKLSTPDLLEVWQDMMMADIFIMSKSSFSIVPAVLSRNGTIIYTQFWHKPLQHWKVADNNLLREANNWVQDVRKTKCNKNK